MLYNSHSYTEINLQADKILLLPLGATEQHGPHLATGTDTDIVGRLATAAEMAKPQDIILAPALPFGSSHHHLSFGGTISVSAELYTQLVKELVASLLEGGFRRILLLNGHGGNITPVRQALALLSREYDGKFGPNIALATYWELAGSAFAGDGPMESPALSHACEYETSLMLHLYPEKVWMDRAARAKRPEQNGYIAWEDDIPYRGVSIFKQTAFISDNGSSGMPQLASANKGAHLFRQALAALISFVESFKTWPLLPGLAKQHT